MRVLVVDDSALMRKHLVGILSSQPDIELQVARNGTEAVERLIAFEPDVITLDVNMPVMDGLTALSLIMAQRPTPVVMVSSITTRGAASTLEALALGAVDFITKPEGTISLNVDAIHGEILTKVRTAASARMQASKPVTRSVRKRQVPPAPATISDPADFPVVIVGVSTGGPRTLEGILPMFPAGFPGVVLVAQHMPANFTAALAQRMNQACALPVAEIQGPTPLRPGQIWIAKGGADLTVSRRHEKLVASPVPEDARYFWHPSVSRLVSSASQHIAPRWLTGVMLTGMGNDGAAEMAALHRAGGKTIAEDESTAVVFGMPAELIRQGGASVTLPADQVTPQLLSWLMPAP